MTKIDFDNLREVLMTGNLNDYTNVMCDFSELVEELIFMFNNSKMFNENERYDLIEQFRKVCECVSEDRRGTGTLMKDLGL